MGRVTPKKNVSASAYVPLPKEQTNNGLAQTDEAFRQACEAAGVTPTGKQYSKWRRGRGLAKATAKTGAKISPKGTEV